MWWNLGVTSNNSLTVEYKIDNLNKYFTFSRSDIKGITSLLLFALEKYFSPGFEIDSDDNARKFVLTNRFPDIYELIKTISDDEITDIMLIPNLPSTYSHSLAEMEDEIFRNLAAMSFHKDIQSCYDVYEEVLDYTSQLLRLALEPHRKKKDTFIFYLLGHYIYQLLT